MKSRTLLVVATTGITLVLGTVFAVGQTPTGAGQPQARVTSSAEQVLKEALAGPDGEYANYAVYAAIVQKFGEVQPYASILRSEECHIAALKRHFELSGLAVPENAYLGKIPAPDTLQQAAEAGVALEQRNVSMYGQLLEQIKDQAELVRVFTHLQWASREHHLPAFEAAVAQGGQLKAGQFVCGPGAGAGRRGPPAWAGGGNRGFGAGKGGCGACGLGTSAVGAAKNPPGQGNRYSPANPL